MSCGIEDLYDYELVQKCINCGCISLKSDFHKQSSTNDGYNNICKVCFKSIYEQY